VVSQCFSGKYPPRNRDGQFGEPGRALSAPLSPLQKRPSVHNPLTPRYRQEKSRQIAESTIRPVSGVTGAPLPHQRPQFRSRSGRLHPHQAIAGAPLRQAWNVNTEGNCNRERGCVAYGNLAGAGTAHGATTSTVAKHGQHRHRTARVHVADYARPATLTNTIGTAHGRTRPQWRNVKSAGNTVKSHKYRSRKPTETCHVPAPLTAWPGG
jgi:hypothetical protein